MKKFFVGCNIRFEDELEKEMQEFWPFLLGLDGRPHSESLRILDKVPGGLLLEASLHLGLQIHFFSKLANRVLLRLHESKIRDFPKLFRTLQELKSNSFLKGLKLNCEVSAKQSRLNNEKRIEEIVHEIFGEHPDSEQSLYIRMSDDLCSISLDCTGPHLHQRSERHSQGEAPLRETIAAFGVRKLIGDMSAAELQGIDLIDPMCGTGTLIREASTLFQTVLRENFSFLQWESTPKLLKSPSFRRNYPEMPSLFAGLKAFDVDPASTERAQSMLDFLGSRVEIQTKDLFTSSSSSSSSSESSKNPCWVISNPPYGERLKADFTPGELVAQIQKVYRPQRMGLILSESQSRQLKVPKGLRLQEQWPFQNGGLRVVFSIFRAV